MYRFMDVVVVMCLSKQLLCVEARGGILHFYMFYQLTECNICVVRKVCQSVIKICMSVAFLQGRPRIMSNSL